MAGENHGIVLRTPDSAALFSLALMGANVPSMSARCCVDQLESGEQDLVSLVLYMRVSRLACPWVFLEVKMQGRLPVVREEKRHRYR